MTAVETTLSFDDILEAVRESRRGRWFLEEFESRLRKTDTASLLAAIGKLESVVTSMGVKGPEAEILARAKAAIMAARKDIATIDPGASGLTEEGRLFAQLADMARRSFAANSNVSPATVNTGVVRALRLVDELEADILGSDGQAGKPAEARPTAYFQQDSEVFETARPAAEIVQVTARKKEPEPVARGARLVINRTAPRPDAEAAPAAEAPTTAETPAVETPAAPAPAPVAVAEEAPADVFKAEEPKPEAPRQTPRVVIIRKKPEEMTQVPMLDQPSTSENAA